MSVHLHIDRLVLDGIDLGVHDQAVLRDAAATELATLLRGRALPDAIGGGMSVPTVRGADISVTRDASAEQIGAAIARSVYGGISR